MGRGGCLFEPGIALGILGQIALALEAAVGEAGEGVEHAEVVKRIGGEGFAQGIGAGIGDDFADLCGGKLLGGLEAVDWVRAGQEIKGMFLPKAALIAEALLAQVVLVAACVPASDMVLVEVFAVFAEVLDDLVVGEAVIEHFVDLAAEVFGEAGDSAVTPAPALRGS